MRNEGRGRMHKTNWIFEQTPPPHFCLKVLCKKGGGAYFRELTVILLKVGESEEKSLVHLNKKVTIAADHLKQ